MTAADYAAKFYTRGHELRVRTDVDYWSDYVTKDPGDYQGRHRQVDPPQWRCICAGQGGSVYSSGCPVHDASVDTESPSWRKFYDDAVEAQLRIKERLGW